MRPLFTIHAGEFVVGDYIEGKFRRRLQTSYPSTTLHKFAVIVVAGDVDPGRPQRGQLQHGLL